MFEIVGMFPDIDTYDRLFSVWEWRILTDSLTESEFTILVSYEPRPSRTKYSESFASELIPELIKASKSVLNSCREFASC